MFIVSGRLSNITALMRSFNVTTENKSYKWTCIKLMMEKEKVSHRKDIQSFLLTNEQNRILNEKISGYRKGHSKPTAWLSFRDDIIQAMKKGGLTMSVFADFSKAFNIVDHTRILEKNAKKGFPKALSTLDSKLHGWKRGVCTSEW